MTDVRATASAALGVPLAWDGEPLRGSDRAVVRRAWAGDQRVVVKSFAPALAGEGFVREAAALRLLVGRGAQALELLAVRTQPPLTVTADLGTGPSLADALLGVDPAAAVVALTDWAVAVASVHRVSAGAGPAFAAELAQLQGDLPVDPDSTAGEIAFGVGRLREWLPRLGVQPTEEALAEVYGAPGRLDGGPVALSPGDTCPDNNVRTAHGLALVDFEGGCLRPIAWDAAYLLVPWPTCWCSWALPADLAATGLARWRDGVREVFPAVDSASFDRDITLAAAAWSLVTVGWFLPNAVGTDPPPEDPRLLGLVPSRRAIIQHRLAGLLARDCTGIPAIAELAEQLLAATIRTWGRVPLPLAPAFRGSDAAAGTGRAP